MNQNTMILQHLEEFGSITAAEAREQYGCNRLASRIKELRMMGYEIDSSIEVGKNRYDKYVRYARYRMEN